MNQGLIVKKIQLFSHRRQSEANCLDLTEYYSNLEIIEDIFSNNIYGTLVLNEVHNVASSPIDRKYTPGPIIGNETVVISLYEERNGSTLDLTMKIYKVFSRTLSNTKLQTTVLNLVTDELVQNSQIKLSKTYKEKLYSEMVEDILVNDIWKGQIPPNTDYDIEPTDKRKNIIIPYWNPLETINWISSRSISEVYYGASYLFYESLNNHRKRLKRTFNFKTLELLYDSRIVKKLETTIANISDPTIDPNAAAKFDQERIQKYEFDKTFNLFDNMQMGMYANTLIQHDILNKKFDKTVFNYLDEYPKIKHSEVNQGNGRLISKLSVPLTESPEQNMILYVKNNSMYSGKTQDDSFKITIPFRKSQIQQLNNVRIFVTIAADASLSVGDLVELNITSPKFSADIPTNKDQSFDKYYREKFIITCIRHHIQTELPSLGVYSMTLELSKDTLYVNPLNEGQLPGRSN